MTNAERVMRALDRKGESKEFKAYCENMLAYFPYASIPSLRDYYKHSATALEVSLTTGIRYGSRKRSAAARKGWDRRRFGVDAPRLGDSP